MTLPIEGFPVRFTGSTRVMSFTSGGVPEPLGGQNLAPRAAGSTVGQLWYGSETHEVSVTKTEYPIEDGANIIDHAVRNPSKLTLTGKVSTVSFVPYPFGRPDPNVQSLPPGTTYTENVGSPADLNQGEGIPADIRAPGDVWQQILKFVDQNRVVTVDTVYGRYNNMMITNATGHNDGNTGMNLDFTIELEEVFIVDNISRFLPDAETFEPDLPYSHGDVHAERLTLPLGWANFSRGEDVPVGDPLYFDLSQYYGEYYLIKLGGIGGGNPIQRATIVWGQRTLSGQGFAGFSNDNVGGGFYTIQSKLDIEVRYDEVDERWMLTYPYVENPVSLSESAQDLLDAARGTTGSGQPDFSNQDGESTAGQRGQYGADSVPMLTWKFGTPPRYEIGSWQGGVFVVLPTSPYVTGDMKREDLGNSHHLYLIPEYSATSLRDIFERHLDNMEKNWNSRITNRTIGYISEGRDLAAILSLVGAAAGLATGPYSLIAVPVFSLIGGWFGNKISNDKLYLVRLYQFQSDEEGRWIIGDALTGEEINELRLLDDEGQIITAERDDSIINKIFPWLPKTNKYEKAIKERKIPRVHVEKRDVTFNDPGQSSRTGVEVNIRLERFNND